jgi:hypothetical protein
MAFYKGHEDSTVTFSKDEVELLREAIQTQQFKFAKRLVDIADKKELNFASATAVSQHKSLINKQFLMLESAKDKIDATYPTLKEKN